MARSYIYRDLNTNFEANPFSMDLSTVTDENAITQSIKNIILTDKYEVPFEPNFGGNVNALLFEIPSPLTEAQLREQIEFSIKNYEPRIELLDVIVQGDPDNNRYNIRIDYTSVIAESISSVNFFLERIL